ncbi:MAG: PepSY domain-containing protein [Nanoarchaeota archaeon]
MLSKSVLLSGSLILAILLSGALIVTATYMWHEGPNDSSITALAVSKEQATTLALGAVKGIAKETELEKENERLLYSVEIDSEKGLYKVKVDPYTGELVKVETEDDVGKRELEIVNPKITEEQAKDIALGSFRGVITDFEAKKLNGKYVYEVEVTSENAEADVLIDMMNGKVLRIEQDAKEDDDKDEDEPNQEELNNLQPKITQEQAIKIALAEVNGEVTDVEIERKRGKEVYTVEIDDNGDEVDIFVDTKTGHVVGTERDTKEDD